MAKRRSFRNIIFLCSLLSISLAIDVSHSMASGDKGQKPEYVSGELLIKFKEGVDPQPVLQQANLAIENATRVYSIAPVAAKFKRDHKIEKSSNGWYSFLGKNYKEVSQIPDEKAFEQAYKAMPESERSLYRTYKVKVSAGESIESAVAKLKIDPNVEYAEPNYIKKAQLIPNDPLYSQQWSHQKTQAPDGWDIETGKPNVIVAIIDTGVDYNHQDLAANVWHDPAGNPGADFVDIDTAEYIKSGYTLIAEEDYTAQDNEPMDFNGHGTHCAGIACGVGNNGLGISGVAQHCKIMPVRAGFSIRNGATTYGAFENDDISNSIVFAADNGADIISMSFGGSDKSIIIEDAIKYAVSKNVILVAAAGNEYSDQKSYPAAYNDVISVGAIDQNSNRASFSNYGTWIDVMAPGVDILSTVPLQGTLSDPSGYKVLSGTSMACPYTAGLAALIKSSHNDWTSDAIKKRIYTCTIPGPDDYFYGFGIVNIFRAVSPDPVKYLCARISSPDYYPSNNVTNRFYKQFSKDIIIKGTVLGSDFTHYTIEAGEGANPTAWFTVGVDLRDSGAGEVTDDVLGNWDISNIPDGVYTIKLTAFDIYGKSVTTKITIIVNNSIRSGWPQDTFAGQGDFLCSPVIEDIDGDGKSEILVGSYGGLLYAWHDDGSPVSGWPVFVGVHIFTPSIGDVDNDGSMEIVAASPDCSLIFRNDGTPYSGEWPKKMSSAPALADIDGDGDLEILAGDGFYHMCAWHHTGQSVAGWPANIVSSKIHAPAVGDIDGDGGLEIVAAEEAMSGTQVVGNVYAWHSNGTLVSGNWPVNVSGGRGYPVIGDINNDGKLEVVLNTNAGLFAFRGDGYVLPYWPKVSSSKYSKLLSYGVPALADINGDDVPEVIIAEDANLELLSSGWQPAKICVFSEKGRTDGWPYVLTNFYNPPEISGVVVADIDADLKPEIIFSAIDSYDSKKYLYALTRDGTVCPGYPKQIDIDSAAIPAVADLQHDGTLQIAAFGTWDGQMPTPFYVYDIGQLCSERKMDWPMLGHDVRHTGCLPLLQNRGLKICFIGDKTVREATELRFIVSATDVVYNFFTYSADNLPDGATFDGQLFKWTPAHDQIGTHNVTFRVTNGTATVSETIAIKVLATNRAPIIVPIGTKAVSDNQKLEFVVTASDPDDDNLSYSASGLPQGAAFIAQTFSWTPTSSQVRPYVVTFNVSDGNQTVSEAVTINVNHVDRPPRLDAIGNRSINENQELSFTIAGSDPDNDSIFYSVSGLPYGASFDQAGRIFRWTPAYDQSGQYNVTFTVTDGTLTASEVIVITVNNVNRLPVFNSIGNKTVDENTILSFTISATDPDVGGSIGGGGIIPIGGGELPIFGKSLSKNAAMTAFNPNNEVLTYSAAGLPVGAVFNPATQVFEWTPAYDQAGTYNVTFTVSDGELSASESIAITVNNTNRPPALDAIGNKAINEGKLLKFTIVGSDPDGDSLTYSANWLPVGAILDPKTGLFSWTPSYYQAGNCNVTFIVSDGSLQAAQSVTIQVNNINGPPVINPIGDKTVNRKKNLKFTVTSIDPDKDHATYIAQNMPLGAHFTSKTGLFSWTPTIRQAGTFKVTFIAKDSKGNQSSQVTVAITVSNKAPVLYPVGDKSVINRHTLSFKLTAYDPDSIDKNNLRFYAEGLPKGAHLGTSGTFRWKPTKNQVGSYKIRFFVKDPPGLTNAETVTLVVK